jgi:hypothetical protein
MRASLGVMIVLVKIDGYVSVTWYSIILEFWISHSREGLHMHEFTTWMFSIDSHDRKKCLRPRVLSYRSTVCGGMHVY